MQPVMPMAMQLACLVLTRPGHGQQGKARSMPCMAMPMMDEGGVGERHKKEQRGREGRQERRERPPTRVTTVARPVRSQKPVKPVMSSPGPRQADGERWRDGLFLKDSHSGARGCAKAGENAKGKVLSSRSGGRGNAYGKAWLFAGSWE